jgi:hypothetical protein
MPEKKSRSRQIFRRTDLTRAIKGAIAAEIEIARAEIEPHTGKIVIVFGKSVASSTVDSGEPGGWDHI